MRKMSGSVKFLRRNAAAYMFLAPWLLGFLVLTLYPMLYSLWLGFTDYDFTQPDSTQWVGLGNYARMFAPLFGQSQFTTSTGEAMRADPYYLRSLSVTFTYVFVSVPLKLVFALAVAVLMNQRLRGVPFYRAVYYIPTLLGGSVAIAVTTLPAGGEKSYAIQMSQYLGINKASANKEAAALFINFFVTSPEAGAALETNRGVPSSPVVRQAISGQATETDAAVYRSYDAVADRTIPQDPNLPNDQEFVNELELIGQRVAFGESTVVEGAEALQALIERMATK